jgi:hypothetical protein
MQPDGLARVRMPNLLDEMLCSLRAVQGHAAGGHVERSLMSVMLTERGVLDGPRSLCTAARRH